MSGSLLFVLSVGDVQFLIFFFFGGGGGGRGMGVVLL